MRGGREGGRGGGREGGRYIDVLKKGICMGYGSYVG